MTMITAMGTVFTLTYANLSMKSKFLILLNRITTLISGKTSCKTEKDF